MGPVVFSTFQFMRTCMTRKSTVIPMLLLITILLGASPIALAQLDVGYILGTVTDQTGAAVPGAKVTITQEGTGITQHLLSNKLGYYTSQPLQVGRYTVLVSESGFSTTVIRNVTVDAAAHVQANLTLHVGAAAATIRVEGAPPVMDTTDAMLSTTIDAHDAQQLPVNGRSVLTLAQFTPGVVSAADHGQNEGFENRGTAVSDIRVAGGAPGYNNYLLDGVSNVDNWLGEVAINLKSDAVQEFTVMSGVIPAQYGYTSGGVINAVTRSGSNQVHGSVYEFFRNDALDAQQTWPRPAFGKGETRFNNYGGTLGGPIRHNKIFLFGNYEQYNFASKAPEYFSVPTVQERSGNFSDLGHVVNGVCQPLNVYDDSNIVNGQRQQFNFDGIPNNINPALLDPVALAYQKEFYPLPNNTTGSYNSCTHSDNLLYSMPVWSSERQGVVRSDWKISGNDSAVARYAYYRSANNDGSSTNGGFPGGLYSNRYDTFEGQVAALSETHVFNPSLINVARLGGMLADFPFAAGSANKNIAGQIGLPNDTSTIIPTMSNGVLTPNITLGFRSSTTLEGVDDLTLIQNKQTLHIGASVRFAEGYNNQSNASQSGTFNFSSATTAEGNDSIVTTGTGSEYAAYLLGQVHSASQEVNDGYAYRRMMYALYAQDDWRATPRLTINAGLRWDFMSQAVERHNGLENFDITKTNSMNGYAGAVEYAGVDGNGRNFVAENYGDFGPRLGFAYALTSDNKMMLRGGFAIYYPATDQEQYDSSSGSTNGYTTLSTSYGTPTPDGIAFQLQNGFPYMWNLPLGAAGGQNAFLGQSASYTAPDAKDPSAQVFTLALSREFLRSWVVDLSYLGNHGNHFLNSSPNIDTLPPQYYSMGTAALSASVSNPYAGKVPGTLGAATITEANLLEPYPYMTSVSLQSPRNASYWANYALLSVRHRMFHGLDLIGAYTFGKITDEGIIGFSNGGGFGNGTAAGAQNWRNPQADHSVDNLDVKNQVNISALYELPFGKGQRFLSGPHLKRLKSGWQYNIISTLQSGKPIGVSGASNHLASRPNWNPNVSVFVKHQSRSELYKTGRLEWFNPDAFINPADYTFGNTPRNISTLRGPGYVNFDMSLIKTTHIAGRANLELRLEAYNAFNHPSLSGPNSSFSAGPPTDPSNPYAEGGLNDNANFGMITGTAVGANRELQLGATISF